MFQFGNATRAFVIPARFRRAIAAIIALDIFWIGHNGPHDIRSLDVHLGYETGVHCGGETFIPCHHADSRNAVEGGVNHGLKEQCEAHIDGSSGKWEKALKARFKEILIPIPGELYKSGPRKGTQKYRKAKLSEGWALIDPHDPAYVAYAGADPILTFRLWYFRRSIVEGNKDLYSFDLRVQLKADRLQRRAIKLDVNYTTRFRENLNRKASRYADKARVLGCDNIYSGAQIANALLALGANLSERTPSGKWKTDDKILRAIATEDPTSDAARLVRAILTSKRLTKRSTAYADAMLRERDANDRVHPSIKTLGARTTRMSISDPALQQLPVKEND